MMLLSSNSSDVDVNDVDVSNPLHFLFSERFYDK
jgi:hypothetical protein